MKSSSSWPLPHETIHNGSNVGIVLVAQQPHH
jgi:hypothetical protein